MASALSVVVGTINNMSKIPASVAAGSSASFLIFLAGAALVAAGVAIPPISIFGLHLIAVSTPITMTMVGAAATALGHVVTTIVPDTYNQQINALAKKVQTSVEDLKEIVPKVEDTYPTDTALRGNMAERPSDSNINNG